MKLDGLSASNESVPPPVATPPGTVPGRMLTGTSVVWRRGVVPTSPLVVDVMRHAVGRGHGGPVMPATHPMPAGRYGASRVVALWPSNDDAGLGALSVRPYITGVVPGAKGVSSVGARHHAVGGATAPVVKVYQPSSGFSAHPGLSDGPERS